MMHGPTNIKFTVIIIIIIIIIVIFVVFNMAIVHLVQFFSERIREAKRKCSSNFHYISVAIVHISATVLSQYVYITLRSKTSSNRQITKW